MILCLFDIDGTILQEHPRMLEPYVDAIAEGVEVDTEQGSIPLSGKTDHVILSRLLQSRTNTNHLEGWQRTLDRYHNHLAANLQRYPRSFVPGAIGFIRGLASRNVGLGLATGNTRVAARAKLGDEIFDLFPAGGFAEHGPERASILAAAMDSSFSASGCRFDTTVYFADTPSDIEAARAIGALSIAVAAGSYTKDALKTARPSFIIDSFEELSRVEVLLDCLPHLEK